MTTQTYQNTASFQKMNSFGGGDRNEVDRARLIAKDASDLSWEDIHRMRAELIAKNPSASAEYAYKNMFPHVLKREYDNMQLLAK